MPQVASGQTWLYQPLPVSTVPNTGRSLYSSISMTRLRLCGYGKRERERERERGGGTSKEYRPQRRRGEQLRCDGGPADLQKTKGHRTELQQQRLQACEKNWVRKIARVTKADGKEWWS